MDAYTDSLVRDALILRFESRLSREQLFTLHNGLMIDYDHLPDAVLAALAEGPVWMTFEITELGTDSDNTFGYIDLGVDEHGTAGREFGTLDLDWARDFADLLGLEHTTNIGVVVAWGGYDGPR